MGFLQRMSEDRASWTGPFSLNPNAGKYKDPALSRLFGGGAITDAGIHVTRENAMQFSAVFAAVNMIANDVAKLPLNLMKRRREGGSDHYIDSKLYHLLKNEPNPDMSAMTLRRTMVAHALTCHGGYAEIQRDGVGRTHAIWLLTPDRVEPFRQKQSDGTYGPLVYRIDNDDRYILAGSDVVHIQGLGYDGLGGYELINLARQTIGLALAAEKFGAQYFGKGTVFGGVVETSDELDGDQRNDLRAEIEAARSAQNSAFRIMVMEGGKKFNQFTNKPAESQMDESRMRQVEEVARFFRIPPAKMGINRPGAVSHNSAEAQNLDYYSGALLDWITQCEQEFNRKLISPFERRQQYIKHNANAFLRADTAGRAKFYESLLDRGVLNADDVLELEDMNPQPGGQGKMYLVQGAQVPKDQLAAMVDARIKGDMASATTPELAPAPAATDDDEGNRQRLQAAELALAEARTTLDAERTARVDAEAAGRATIEELAMRRAAEQEAASTLARLTGVVEDLRSDLASRDSVIVEQSGRAAALAQELEGARVDLTAVTEAVAQASREAETLRVRHGEATVALEAAQGRVAVAEATIESAGADRSAATAALETARSEAREAQSRADDADASRVEIAEHLESLREASDAAHADVARLSGELEAARGESSALRTDVEQATADVARGAQALAVADIALSQLRTDLTVAQENLAARDVDLETLRSTLAERTSRVACATCHDAGVPCPDCPAGVAIAVAINERDSTRATLADVEARVLIVETDRTSLSAQLESLRAELNTTQAETAANATARDSAEAEVVSLRAAVAATTTEAALATATGAASEAALAEARQALETGRQATRTRMIATIAAHRGLFVDAMGRMTRREASQARTKQATPAKLRRWLEDFEAVQVPICIEALVPAMRTHLAWSGSDHDPVTAATTIAREHVALFIRRVEDVLEGPVEEFHAELETTLTRWEADRAGVVADAILAEEVRHAAR